MNFSLEDAPKQSTQSYNPRIVRALIGICGALFMTMVAVWMIMGFYVAEHGGLIVAAAFSVIVYSNLCKAVMRDEKVMAPKQNRSE